MLLDKGICYAALLSHDARFDGVFFTCVRTTGIYCRPICPTSPPKLQNCSFVASAALAEKAGYRPCLRCRPELSPLAQLTDNSPAHMLRRHIEETLLMDETLGHVAASYGISERQLRRTFNETFGVTPKGYVMTRRLLFAKQLLQETTLSVVDVAYSSGFNTPGRLTIAMRESYNLTPRQLRKQLSGSVESTLVLRAGYRPPFDWNTLLDVLSGRSTPAEYIADGVYHRIVQDKVIRVANDAGNNQITVTIPAELSRQAHAIMQAARRLFDLDANPAAISETLSADPRMKALIKRHPGIRVPGAWDAFELLIRVIVGQQISVAGATTIMRRIVDRIGMTPDVLAAATPQTIAQIGMPLKRAVAIQTVSALVRDGSINLTERNPERFYQQLVAVPGIGPWTAEYLCMRLLHWPDAFPAGDLGIQKALGTPGKKFTESAARTASHAWRPWRSYATMLLWKSISNQGG